MTVTDNNNNYITHDIANHQGLVYVYRNYWWWCVEGDPKRALFYRVGKRGVGSPQCNQVEAVALRVGESLGRHKRAKLIKVELGFCPWEE